jgi:hypothetical protein
VTKGSKEGPNKRRQVGRKDGPANSNTEQFFHVFAATDNGKCQLFGKKCEGGRWWRRKVKDERQGRKAGREGYLD